jgi:very-short-patch-repair endonuclease
MKSERMEKIDSLPRLCYPAHMLCKCGKIALYHVHDKGYCQDHREVAVRRIQLEAKYKFRGKQRVKRTPKPKPGPEKRQPIIEKQSALRRYPTAAEIALKAMLDREAMEYDFQPIVSGYIPDFVIPPVKLVIEVDGSQHYTAEGQLHDDRRTNQLKRRGYKVIRFENREVFSDPESVFKRIRSAIGDLTTGEGRR